MGKVQYLDHGGGGGDGDVARDHGDGGHGDRGGHHDASLVSTLSHHK